MRLWHLYFKYIVQKSVFTIKNFLQHVLHIYRSFSLRIYIYTMPHHSMYFSLSMTSLQKIVESILIQRIRQKHKQSAYCIHFEPTKTTIQFSFSVCYRKIKYVQFKFFTCFKA